ncbi:MAG: penicillin-insensitive murein endopeptidase [Myxococcota bacterium]
MAWSSDIVRRLRGAFTAMAVLVLPMIVGVDIAPAGAAEHERPEAEEELECHDCGPSHGASAADDDAPEPKEKAPPPPAKKASPPAKKSPKKRSAPAPKRTRAKKCTAPAHDHDHGHEPSGAAPARRDDRTVDIAMSSRALRQAVRKNLRGLGPMSVGRPQQGALVNPKRFPDGKLWRLMSPGNAYGTTETIDFLKRAIEKVHQTHPGGHRLFIGDISARHGGSLKGHRSHQAGRDVDTSFYYRASRKKPARWYRVATAETLDVVRTWAFVRALITETDVKFIFINTSVQKLLKEHALKIGEDPKWLDRVFQYRSRDPWPIVRHSPGHDTHIHIRFYNPRAQELGRRAYPHLVSAGIIKPHVYYTRYTAKKGDILGRIAKRFDCSVDDIVRANKLRGARILAGKTYRIPREGHVHQLGRVKIPARRLPRRTGSSARRARAGGS